MNQEQQPVRFFAEEVDMPSANLSRAAQWLEKVAREEKQALGEISVIFCSDEYLYRLNVEHLQHHTYTDIITFPYSDSDGISGDLFISTERVEENAREFNSTFEEELHRVLVHGLLHLLGYADKTDEEKTQMRKREDHYLKEVFNRA